MKLSYSSLAAFIAHYRILNRAAELSEEERERLAKMTELTHLLAPAEREAIESTAASDRRSERALRNLHQLLAARGVLSD